MKEGVDYYINENGLYVFTEVYLHKRSFCCRNGCMHCPYGYVKQAYSYFKDQEKTTKTSRT